MKSVRSSAVFFPGVHAGSSEWEVGKVKEEGVHITLRICNRDDLNSDIDTRMKPRTADTIIVNRDVFMFILIVLSGYHNAFYASQQSNLDPRTPSMQMLCSSSSPLFFY